MIMNGEQVSPMENTSAPSSNIEWTLADFLSTYRYWALFFSHFFWQSADKVSARSFP